MEINTTILIYNLVLDGLKESLGCKEDQLKQYIGMTVTKASNLPDFIKNDIANSDNGSINDGDIAVLVKVLTSDETGNKNFTEDKFNDLIARCLKLDKSDVSVQTTDVEQGKFFTAKFSVVDNTEAVEKTQDNNTGADNEPTTDNNKTDDTKAVKESSMDNMYNDTMRDLNKLVAQAHELENKYGDSSPKKQLKEDDGKFPNTIKEYAKRTVNLADSFADLVDWGFDALRKINDYKEREEQHNIFRKCYEKLRENVWFFIRFDPSATVTDRGINETHEITDADLMAMFKEFLEWRKQHPEQAAKQDKQIEQIPFESKK